MTNTKIPKQAWNLKFGAWCLVIGISLWLILTVNSQVAPPPPPAAAEFQLINGIIHLHTPVSGGNRSIDDYLKLANERHIGILIITDHDNLNYSYSIHPLRWLIKKTVEKESVLNFGISRYLELINDAGKNNPAVTIIDGVESIPFYYWTGSAIKTQPANRFTTRRELMLHNRGKHMLVIGLKTPSAYEHLPLIANGLSRYDAYHGQQNEAPYQDLIDYVNKQGGLTFWAHPEAEEKRSQEGITIHTLSYHESLLHTRDYTGFSVFSEGYTKIGRIGGIWDTVLTEYCAGKRKSPVWAIGELDDYGEKSIDGIQTIFLLNDNSYDGIINALKSGKIYVVTKSGNNPLLRLERFTIEDRANPQKVASSGDEITISGTPLIRIKLTHQSPPTSAKVTVKLIRNGRLLKEYNETLPYETAFADNDIKAGEKTYYRLDITDEFGGKVISNPIFVK